MAGSGVGYVSQFSPVPLGVGCDCSLSMEMCSAEWGWGKYLPWGCQDVPAAGNISSLRQLSVFPLHRKGERGAFGVGRGSLAAGGRGHWWVSQSKTPLAVDGPNRPMGTPVHEGTRVAPGQVLQAP